MPLFCYGPLKQNQDEILSAKYPKSIEVRSLKIDEWIGSDEKMI